MEHRVLGRTGHRSGVAVLDAAAFARATPEQTAKSFEEALFHGVNHLDVSPADGDALTNLGPLVPDRRDRLFLASRTTRCDPEGIRAQLDTSLTRLGVEHLDLWQVDGVDGGAELDRRADAVEVLLAARDEGLTAWAGIVGGDLGAPAALLTALRRWDLDTVVFPLSPRLWSEPAYRDDVSALLHHTRLHSVGVIVSDVLAWRPWHAPNPDAATWYEPHTARNAMKRNVDFVLSTPGVHGFTTPADRGLLGTVLDVAERPGFVSSSRRSAIVAEAAAEPIVFPRPGPDALVDP